MGLLRRLFGRDDVGDNGLPVPPRAPVTGDLVLVDSGPKKIEVIKVVREATGLGLREAKDLVESAPVAVDAGMHDALVRAGAVVQTSGRYGTEPSFPAPVTPSGYATGPAEVYLVDAGEKKIQVIKVVREATGLGLREAKDLVERAPTLVASGLSPDAAATLHRDLEKAGARVG